MEQRFGDGFEAGLQKRVGGLVKPRSEKRHDKLLERIGQLKARSHGASQRSRCRFSGLRIRRTPCGCSILR